jgi:hypothetical protein
MIVSTSTNYTGRKRDISVIRSPDATVAGPQNVALSFGRNGQYCAGLQKIIQKYAIILLTNIGSQFSYPAFGTNFLTILQGGFSPIDVLRASQVFNLASYDAVRLLKTYQVSRDDIPDDERIASATLVDIALYNGSASFDVAIATEAGSSMSFLIPLPR